MSMTCSQREETRRAARTAERETALAARDAERASRSDRPAAGGSPYICLMHSVGLRHADRIANAHQIAADAVLDDISPSELERLFREFLDAAGTSDTTTAGRTSDTARTSTADPWADIQRQLAAQRDANSATEKRDRELVSRAQDAALAELARKRARYRI